MASKIGKNEQNSGFPILRKHLRVAHLLVCPSSSSHNLHSQQHHLLIINITIITVIINCLFEFNILGSVFATFTKEWRWMTERWKVLTTPLEITKSRKDLLEQRITVNKAMNETRPLKNSRNKYRNFLAESQV